VAKSLVIVGAGGFGRETIDVVQAVNAAAPTSIWELTGVVDDSPSDLNLARLEALSVPYLGTLDRLADFSHVAVAIGVGSPQARATIANRIDMWDLRTPDLVHPSAVVGSQFSSQGGLIACAHVSVGTNVTVGRHVHLNPDAVIGHDTSVGSFVSVNPSATISGDCTVEDGVLIGVAGVILNRLTVRAHSTIGGSACVVQDVPEGATVKGVPAR